MVNPTSSQESPTLDSFRREQRFAAMPDQHLEILPAQEKTLVAQKMPPHPPPAVS